MSSTVWLIFGSIIAVLFLYGFIRVVVHVDRKTPSRFFDDLAGRSKSDTSNDPGDQP